MARFHRLKHYVMLGPGRTRELIKARRQVILLARESDYSYPRIGEELRRHHTTIIHQHQRALRTDDQQFLWELERIRRNLAESR